MGGGSPSLWQVPLTCPVNQSLRRNQPDYKETRKIESPYGGGHQVFGKFRQLVPSTKV